MQNGPFIQQKKCKQTGKQVANNRCGCWLASIASGRACNNAVASITPTEKLSMRAAMALSNEKETKAAAEILTIPPKGGGQYDGAERRVDLSAS